MSMSSTRKHHLRQAIGAIGLAACLSLSQPANAQLLFDWGGSEKINDSGREFVRINVDAKPGEIIVSFSDRRLFLITQPGMALSFPVAIPREQDRWEGVTSVTQKRENPSWTPTPSMLKENPRLPRWVPGGHPMNPLGNRALYLGSSYYRIHGTDAPWTIGTAVSKGCIRMYNRDAQEVYDRVRLGAKVLVTWKNYQFSPAPENMAPQMVQSAPTTRVSATQRSIVGEPRETQQPRRQRQRAEEVNFDGPPQPRSAAVEEAEPQASSSRNTRVRDATPQRASERSRTPASTEPRQPRARASRVETGALPEPAAAAPASVIEAVSEQAAVVDTPKPRPEPRPQTQAAVPVEVAPAPPPAVEAAPRSPDTAARALEAAERAAAAAERAAAAAERAERAAQVAPKAAPTPAAAPARPPQAQAAEPSAPSE